jgi:hypothetical protein
VKSLLPALTTTTTTSSSSTSSTSVRFISTEQEKEFQSLGLLDDTGLTAFETLHEIQINSCTIFPQNDLFGTYDEEIKSFKFMTYEEWGRNVDRCRALLKDLGECDDSFFYKFFFKKFFVVVVFCRNWPVNECEPIFLFFLNNTLW